MGVLVTLIGFLLVYGPVLYHWIQTGEWPETSFTWIAVGNVMMVIGPWIIKGRSMVKRAVN